MTGCSAGIGLATAKRLAHDPDQRFVIIATVIAMSEKDDLAAAVGDKLDKTVFIKKLDLTVDKDITDVVDDVIKTHGRVDVLRKNMAAKTCLAPYTVCLYEVVVTHSRISCRTPTNQSDDQDNTF